MDKQKEDTNPVDEAWPLTWLEYAIGVVIIVGVGIVAMMLRPTIGTVFSNVTHGLTR